MKKLHIIFLLNLFLQINSLDSNENFDNITYDYDYEYDYTNTKKCLAVTPEKEDSCTKIASDYSVEGKRQQIACCYVTYKSDDEGKVAKCVPVFKTINGIHMYEEQLNNVGASSISINCSSQKLIVSLLMICIFGFLF